MCSKKRCLMGSTTVTVCAAFVFLSIGVSTDYWLFSEEKLIENKTEITYKRTYSGLWRECSESLDAKKQPRNKYCRKIVYFGEVEEDPVGTEAILVSIRRSAPFPLISLLIMIIGGLVCFVGHCNHRRKMLTFIAGIIFVTAGLSTLVGLILYIGSITGEVGNKAKSLIDDPKFIYTYGSSFYMTVTSFVLQEASGVLAVYLYIHRHKTAYKKKQERLAAITLTHSEANDIRPYQGYGRYRRHSVLHTTPSLTRENSPEHSDTYFTFSPTANNSSQQLHHHHHDNHHQHQHQHYRQHRSSQQQQQHHGHGQQPHRHGDDSRRNHHHHHQHDVTHSLTVHDGMTVGNSVGHAQGTGEWRPAASSTAAVANAVQCNNSSSPLATKHNFITTADSQHHIIRDGGYPLDTFRRTTPV